MFRKQDPGTILNNFPSTIHIPYQVQSSHQHPPIIFSKNFLKKEKTFSGGVRSIGYPLRYNLGVINEGHEK